MGNPELKKAGTRDERSGLSLPAKAARVRQHQGLNSRGTGIISEPLHIGTNKDAIYLNVTPGKNGPAVSSRANLEWKLNFPAGTGRSITDTALQIPAQKIERPRICPHIDPHRRHKQILSAETGSFHIDLMAIYQLGEIAPSIDSDAYVANEATVIGNVTIKARASIWPGAVIRGDNERIVVGADSSVQEGAVLHTDYGHPLTVADKVTIGHQAMLHGCTIGEGSLIGIQAVVLDGAVIGKECLVGAGAIVTEGKVFPDRSLILGAPAKVVRELTDEDVARLYQGAESYAGRQAIYKKQLTRIDEPEKTNRDSARHGHRNGAS